ncbi:transglycosylase SLT domain-containing protein [Azonexus hydrophilus]|uniref:Transglycosylase SLT domain-containing protein n=1 Tax=Azonexus hydrophilus TaxID=418702 RepID=A0ABZ2XMD4_9RHOO|nr:transglycosylase SLT domain-containing protein [Azonexus hydrophilus]
MFASQFLSPAASRVVAAVSHVVRKFLMLAGLVFVLGLAGTYKGHSGLLDGLQAMFPGGVSASESESELGDAAVQPVALNQERLVPSMQQALHYVARRYRVSNEVLVPIFLTAQDSARELGLDPLLIIAVIGVESSFNPFSQSVVGAQGLMQVMPRFHTDKLPEDAGELPFFDPVTNVQVGARILRESIARNGGLVPGLQQFGGAINDPERRYSSKVMAERQRLEQAIQQQMQRA